MKFLVLYNMYRFSELLLFFFFNQELPLDARRFAKVNRRWTVMMISAYKTKNVLQVKLNGNDTQSNVMICLSYVYDV